MSDINQEVWDAVRQAARDGKITCTELRKVARDLKVEPRIAGKAAEGLKIKIKSCELGCF
ncbi:MAG: hypothetical protein PHF87_09170 [Desulfotomaculaceae bacterium]|nr:hypothetical protein [Desulfotomaculaceae bacterium]